MRRSRLLAPALALLGLALSASGRKDEDAILVSFHLETSPEEAPKFATPVKLGSKAQQYYFKKIPEFTDRDVAYYYPFVSRDGRSFGVGFKLKGKAAENLKALSLTHQGRLLGCRLPPAHYSAVLIDQPVDHGVIVVWDGLSKEQLKLIGEFIPHAEQVQQAFGPGVPAPDGVR